MDHTKQIETLKNIKTAAKFVRIAKTMFENVRNGISEDNGRSETLGRIDGYIASLSIISGTVDTAVAEKFKTEQFMPGCQFELDFGE